MIEDPLKYVSLQQDGTILLGDYIVCDGYSEGREYAIFTHIHEDHIKYFSKAMNFSWKKLVSQPTYDMLIALEGQPLSNRYDLLPLEFGSPYHTKYKEKITLYRSNHILGSSQVLVETYQNLRILYSSDFNFPEIQTIPCDILVLDSTHGDPRFDMVSESQSLERRLIGLVKDETEEKGKPVVIRAHRGRMQYVMHLLSENLKGAVKFLADSKDCALANVYNKWGMKIREVIPVNNNPQAYRITQGNIPFIKFHTVGGAFTDEEYNGALTIRLSSDVKLFEGPSLKENSPNNYSIDMSDHASFSNILEYVKAIKPQAVITDNVRTKSGITLASEIVNKLGIQAFPSPS